MMCKDARQKMPSQANRHIKQVVGENVKAARDEKGLAQRELAELLGMDQMTVSRWERGRVLPDAATTMPRLAAALDVTIAWLYTDHEEAAA